MGVFYNFLSDSQPLCVGNPSIYPIFHVTFLKIMFVMEDYPPSLAPLFFSITMIVKETITLNFHSYNWY